MTRETHWIKRRDFILTPLSPDVHFEKISIEPNMYFVFVSLNIAEILFLDHWFGLTEGWGWEQQWKKLWILRRAHLARKFLVMSASTSSFCKSINATGPPRKSYFT
jgi:hypothetical protein